MEVNEQFNGSLLLRNLFLIFTRCFARLRHQRKTDKTLFIVSDCATFQQLTLKLFQYSADVIAYSPFKVMWFAPQIWDMFLMEKFSGIIFKHGNSGAAFFQVVMF